MSLCFTKTEMDILLYIFPIQLKVANVCGTDDSKMGHENTWPPSPKSGFFLKILMDF